MGRGPLEEFRRHEKCPGGKRTFGGVQKVRETKDLPTVVRPRVDRASLTVSPRTVGRGQGYSRKVGEKVLSLRTGSGVLCLPHLSTI